jgi:hypothetical protein
VAAKPERESWPGLKIFALPSLGFKISFFRLHEKVPFVSDNSLAKLILPIFPQVSNNCAHDEILYGGIAVGIEPLPTPIRLQSWVN